MNSPLPLEGKTVFVTGAGGGIGSAIAVEFAKSGANLFLLDLRADPLAAVAEEVRAHGAAVRHREGDVTLSGDVEQAMETAELELGALDVLVNCAGIFRSEPLLDCTLEEWNRVMAVNVTGTFLCAQAALRRMHARGRGKIINLSSVAGRVGGKFRAAYAASKHAVIGLTRSIASEFAEAGITANAICPGMIDTEMFAQVVRGDAEKLGIAPKEMLSQLQQRALQKRLIPPAEIARLALYLASSDSDGMTGQALTYSGGMVMQ